jgi:glycosyltransferase involved in cell wall biosynthesis
MRVLFLTHYFPPEVNAPSNRTHEHCREWVAAGHEVHVVTCVPSHPIGQPFQGYRRGWYTHELIDGIHVHRVWTYLAPNKGTIKRTLNYLSFIPTAVFRALRLGRFDVMVGTSPQFFCAVAAWVVASVRRMPWIFELRDLWPDSIAAVGALRKSWALMLLERLELRMYRAASAVVCVTQAFVENLASRGIDRSKIHFIPNGILPSFWTAGDRANERHEAGVMESDIVVSYVGTVGMAHGLDTVLDSAVQLQTAAPAIKFWIVGDGAELDAVRSTVRERGLTNVRLTGLVPRARIPSILAASDISLVTLRASELFKTVLPSKMFESMAAGLPIVLGVDGEAKNVLDRSGAGIAVQPGNADALAGAVADLARRADLRRNMGQSGTSFVEREFSRPVWARRYLDVFAGLVRPADSEPAILSRPATLN